MYKFRCLMGRKEDLDNTPLSIGSIYMTLDTGELFLDSPLGRVQIATSFFNNDVKENYDGEDTLFKVEDKIQSGDKASSDSGYRRSTRDFDLLAAEYESYINRFRGREQY